MPNPQWAFLPQQTFMGMTTELFFKTLPASGFSKEEILVREALQNCRDARSEEAKASGLPVQATIRKSVLSGSEVGKIAELLKLKEASERSPHLADSERSAKFKDLIAGKVSLSALEVSDQNTIGLGGKWDGQAPADHFSRLVINLGSSLKEEGGGSFGFGKTVFAKQSRLNLVVYYSVFEPGEDTGQAHARLMAVWLMKPHDFKGQRYTGFAFLGKSDKSVEGQVEPFIDEEAHELAGKLGMQPRQPSETGTSVLILDCDLDMLRISDSIERYWWPSLHDQALAARVFDGAEQIPVKPKKNPRVAPFLTAYIDLQTNRPKGQETKISTSGTQAREFNRVDGKKLGWLAIRMLSDLEAKNWAQREAELDDEIDDEDGSSHVGGVARIRKSGMVISYENELISQSSPCIGLFEASKDIDQILRISEPQTHDRWDSEERRLDEPQHFGDQFKIGLGRKIVRSVNKRIRDQLRDFQRQAPDPAPPPEYKLKALEALLAKLMNAGDQTIGPDPGPPRPFSISVKPKRTTVKGMCQDIADIELNLHEDFTAESLDIEVVVSRELLGDTSGRVVEKLPCTVEDTEGNVSSPNTVAVLPVCLKKGAPTKLKATGETQDNFKTRYRVQARKPQA